MLKLLARYERFIKDFHVFLNEREGEIHRFKAQLTFIDDSVLFIKEYVFQNLQRKYSYHWADASKNLICRWDNAKHWPNISTYPHHKHTANDVSESTETSVADVLDVIKKQLAS